MAYQNIGSSPRFFIDNYQYLRAMGLDPVEYINETEEFNTFETDDTLQTPLNNPTAFTLSPNQTKTFSRQSGGAETMRFFIPCGEMISGMDFNKGNMKWYTALLNHNLGECGGRIQNQMFMPYVSYLNNIGVQGTDLNPILNRVSLNDDISLNGSTIYYTSLVPYPYNNPNDDTDLLSSNHRYTGFRLWSPFVPAGETDDGIDMNYSDFRVGAISSGVMYTMPHAPDLELSLFIENDGYSTTQTIGGSSLTNINYTGAPSWKNGDIYMNPFGVGEGSTEPHLNGARRNGRRVWTLKFSYLSDKDIFSSNYSYNNHAETLTSYQSLDIDTETRQFEYNMFTDDSFVAQVWNKTCGGALPFIFQPDSENNNPDQFCIAKFDQDSLKISQEAHTVYSFSIKIREVW